MYEIDIYKTASGKEPYTEWVQGLDKSVRARVNARIARIRDTGNLGDCKHFDGIIEIRIDFGPGYRIYCGLEQNTLLLLLLGGDKNQQQKDVDKSKKFWKDHLLNRGKNEKI